MGNRSRRSVTADDLDEFRAKLRLRTRTADKVIASMKRQDIDAMKVSGAGSLDKAYKFLDTFLLYCKKELGEL